VSTTTRRTHVKTERHAFDCVAMKRRGAERVREATEGMTRDEELEFWARGTEELRRLQRRARKRRGSGAKPAVARRSALDAVA